MADAGKLAEVEFAAEALFIDGFDETRAFETMDLDGGADDVVRDLSALAKSGCMGWFYRRD